jgi:hypothetical protein
MLIRRFVVVATRLFLTIFARASGEMVTTSRKRRRRRAMPRSRKNSSATASQSRGRHISQPTV